MADAQVIFQYDFTDDSSLTFFDDQISACWDLDRNFKAIYDGDDKDMPKFNSGLQALNQPLLFSLKNAFHVSSDFEITFALKTARLRNFPLIKIGESGSLFFTPSYMMVSFDKSNQFKITYPTITHQGGQVLITVGRQGSNYTVVITSSQGVVQEVVELPYIKGFDITALFGGLVAMDATFTGIELFDGLTDGSTVEDEIKEEEEETVESVVEEAVEDVAENSTEEVPEDIIKEITETTNKMTPFDKLLPAEIRLLTSYENLAEAFNATRSGTLFTAESIQVYVAKNESYLTKFIYYAITALLEYKNQDHTFLYQRAKYIAPMFGKKMEDEEVKEREYAFKSEKEYDTFEFGKVSNANLTNKMLVKLLMEEYDFWKNEIVKL